MTGQSQALEGRKSGRGRSIHSHGTHVVLWEQWNLQHLGVRLHDLMAGGGHGLASDTVHLVEGVRTQQAVISRTDEELQRQGLTLHVAVELGVGGQRDCHFALLLATYSRLQHQANRVI